MRIFADWGTSNLRAWLVDDQGRVVARHKSDKGLLASKSTGFDRVFAGVVQELGAEPDTPALLLGMVGSQKGWLEVPYAPAPADARAIAASAGPTPDRPNTWIIGGVSCGQRAGRPEVMRGEEVQTLGAIAMKPDARWVCLPGTHAKWVNIENQGIGQFTTYMTGELFDWAINHSIISTQIEGDTFEPEGFVYGLDLADETQALTNAMFQLRTRYLSGSISPSQVRSATSGLLIGYEVKSISTQINGPVVFCGVQALVESYRLACERYGVKSDFVDPEQAAITGLLTLSPLIHNDKQA